MVMFATFVLLSCVVGIFFTVEKSYGYSMGDAFTLAGWVIGVGAFISTGVLAHHYYNGRCKCWQHGGDGDEREHELRLLRHPD